MRNTGYFMTAIALLAAVAGFLLRQREVATVFDPNTGLAARGESVSILLMALSACVLLLLFGLCFRIPERELSVFSKAFPANWLISGLLALFGFFVILSTVLETLAYPAGGAFPIVSYLQTGAALLSGICLSYMAVRGPRRGNVAVAAAVPVFWLCLWLVASHIAEASNPVLLRYVYSFFALAFLLLALYYLAGFAFHQGKPKKFIFSSSAAIYFIGVTMADGHNLYQSVLFLALAATLLVYHLLLTYSLAQPEPEKEKEASAFPWVPPPVSEHKKPYWDVDLDE